MSHRLQVLLDDGEMEEIRRIARRHRMTVAEWVRQALRAARRNEPVIDSESKLDAVRSAARYSFPTTGASAKVPGGDRSSRGGDG
jgi:hypothetical protein